MVGLGCKAIFDESNKFEHFEVSEFGGSFALLRR